MGTQIIRQPNGKLALWSSIVSDFTHYDCTKEEIVEILVRDQRRQIEGRVNDVLLDLDDGKKPYYQFTQTWTEAVDYAKTVHGQKWKEPRMSPMRGKKS